MIEIDLKNALMQPGETFQYDYEGVPEMRGIAFKEPLRLYAEYEATGKAIHVRGRLEAFVRAECVRCLKETAYRLSDGFDELFLPEPAEEDEYTYSDETLSLDKMAYDILVLATPQQVLCKEDCKGLCQYCGQNLNEGPCGCERETADDGNNPFIKLKEFF